MEAGANTGGMLSTDRRMWRCRRGMLSCMATCMAAASAEIRCMAASINRRRQRRRRLRLRGITFSMGVSWRTTCPPFAIFEQCPHSLPAAPASCNSALGFVPSNRTMRRLASVKSMVSYIAAYTREAPPRMDVARLAFHLANCAQLKGRRWTRHAIGICKEEEQQVGASVGKEASIKHHTWGPRKAQPTHIMQKQHARPFNVRMLTHT